MKRLTIRGTKVFMQMPLLGLNTNARLAVIILGEIFIHFGVGKFETEDEEGKKEEQEIIYMEKIGQYPGWNIEMDKELEKMLGEHTKYYKRGLICESQSYGIGAYAYFRRITEDIIDELLESILGLVEEDEKNNIEKN